MRVFSCAEEGFFLLQPGFLAAVLFRNTDRVVFFCQKENGEVVETATAVIAFMNLIKLLLVWAVSNSSMILSYNGKTWRKQNVTSDGGFYAIDGIGGNEVLAIGSSGQYGTIHRRVEYPRYNPSWTVSDVSRSYVKVSRPGESSRKVWGEKRMADTWRVGGNLDQIEEEQEYAYMNVFSLPMVAYLPECVMKDADGDFAFKSDALLPDKTVYLTGENGRLDMSIVAVLQSVAYVVKTEKDKTEDCEWKVISCASDMKNKPVSLQSSYYLYQKYRDTDLYVGNSWGQYSSGSERYIYTNGSPEQNINGFAPYNAVSSNVINLLNLNDTLVFPLDQVFFYHPTPKDPYGFIASESGVGTYIRGKSLSNLLDYKNITNQGNGYFPGKWTVTYKN